MPNILWNVLNGVQRAVAAAVPQNYLSRCCRQQKFQKEPQIVTFRVFSYIGCFDCIKRKKSPVPA